MEARDGEGEEVEEGGATEAAVEDGEAKAGEVEGEAAPVTPVAASAEAPALPPLSRGRSRSDD